MARFLNESPTLYQRLIAEKKRLPIELDLAEPGTTRDRLLEKLRDLNTATHINEWVSSPGLRAPI
ncbi:hypothetical protein [Bradyrhizobium sp.]|jgi:hypothetical protein|uniref:hypothetical protein n=1 Tax=Bradyrhizobium sp. TaxID=376 RepID=UPI003C1778E8